MKILVLQMLPSISIPFSIVWLAWDFDLKLMSKGPFFFFSCASGLLSHAMVGSWDEGLASGETRAGVGLSLILSFERNRLNKRDRRDKSSNFGLVFQDSSSVGS